MIFINPGSESVENATEENAIENMKHFVVDLDKDVEVIRYKERDYNNDYGDGRYCFILKHENYCYEIQMPGLPLEQVRYMNSETQNIWDYPRLYLDGGSLIWKFALDLCTFKDEEE